MTVHDAPRREVRHVKLVLKEILIVDYKMVSARLLVLAALVASASAFAPAPKPLARPVVQKAHPRAARTIVAEGTYWEGEAPPSKVLGNMAAIPSIVLGPKSGVALGVGLYCVASSQFFQRHVHVQRSSRGWRSSGRWWVVRLVDWSTSTTTWPASLIALAFRRQRRNTPGSRPLFSP